MRMPALMGLSVLVALLGTISSAEASSDGRESGGQITYERVLDLTLNNSFKIALADEQVESASRALRDAKRRRSPRLSVQGWFSGDLFELDQWGSNNIGSYLTLDWDFYQNGAILQLVAQSWANLKSALLTRRRTVSEEIHTATSLFYDALKAKRRIEIAEQTLKLDELQLDVARSELADRRIAQSELGEAEARAFDSRQALTRAKQDFQKGIRSLRLLSRDETFGSVQDLPREITWTLDFSLEDAIKTALHDQPNVLIAKSNVELAQLAVKYAKLKRWPSVRFLTGTDYAFAPLARPEDFGFRVGVIVSYPLYDAGDRRSRIEDARSALRRAQIQLWQVQDQMEQEVTDSYAGVSNQLDLLRPAEKRLQKAETNFAIARERYKERSIGELEMGRIRLQYLQSVQQLENLRLDALLARTKLLKSVGVSSTEKIKAYTQKRAEEEK